MYIMCTQEGARRWSRGSSSPRSGLPISSALPASNRISCTIPWFLGLPSARRMARQLSPSPIVSRGEGRGVRDLLPRKGAKKDCLQREQLPAWFAAVSALDNPTASAYLRILLLTGARREELATLKWANVDFKWQSLTIRDKVEGERTIPLTPYVAELLRALNARNVRPLRLPPGEEWKPSPWAFASPTAGSGRIADPRLPHTRALRGAGIDGLTLHGLRRSFGTLAEWVEVPAGIVAQIQGHKPSATAEKHYRARPLDLLRLWHTENRGVDSARGWNCV